MTDSSENDNRTEKTLPNAGYGMAEDTVDFRHAPHLIGQDDSGRRHVPLIVTYLIAVFALIAGSLVTALVFFANGEAAAWSLNQYPPLIAIACMFFTFAFGVWWLRSRD